jgi:hypothetical protein
MIETLSLGLATLVALLAWRAEQLRLNDVFEWGAKGVEALQRLQLLLESTSTDTVSADIRSLATQISVLTEQGRLFFRNAAPEEYGQHKEAAYKGYRPLILDQLVFAYRVADEWEHLTLEERKLGIWVASKCKQRFVGLLQREVGRKRTADRYNRGAGSGHDLRALLSLARAGESPDFPEEEQTLLLTIRRALRV